MNTPIERRLAAQCRRLIEWAEAADEAVSAGTPLDEWLAGRFRKHRECGSRDRRLIKDTLFSFFRWRGWLMQRENIDYAEALLWSDLLDANEVSDWAKELATIAKVDPQHLQPLHAVSLEEKAAYLIAHAAFPADMKAEHLVPEWILPQIDHLPDATDYVAAFQSRPPTWLRFRGPVPAGIEATLHPTIAAAGWIDGAISREWLRGGRADFLVQDLSSQCVGLVAAPQSGETWWDACAGSGGKTLHLADLMGRQGRVLATDARPEIVGDLKRRAAAWGCDHLIVSETRDARSWQPALPCDGVLVDAPCSGVGTWARNPDARWRTDEKSIRSAAKRQRAILSHAATAVRPGGRLVYAVCTITRAETIDVVEAFNAQQPDFELVPFPHPLTGIETAGTVFIEPWQARCGAMFIAHWQRRG